MEKSDVITTGKVLSAYRKSIRVSQKMISDGICSITTYSRIEADVRDVDFYMLQILFERLGVSVEEQEIMISLLDERLYRKRQNVHNCIFTKKYDAAKTLLQQHQNDMPDTLIYRQYDMYMSGLLLFLTGAGKDESVELIRKALSLTHKMTDGYERGTLYSGIETDMLIFLSQHDKALISGAIHILTDILQHIRTYYKGELRKTYGGRVLYSMARLYMEKGRLQEALKYALQAVDVVGSGREIALLPDVHFLIAQIYYGELQTDPAGNKREQILEECRMAYYLYKLYDEESAEKVNHFVKDKIHGIL